MVLPFGGRVGRRRIPKESQVIEALFLLTGWCVWRGGGGDLEKEAKPGFMK